VAVGRTRPTRPVIPSVIWPGFVDALTGILLVLVFTVSTFVLVQFFLRDELAGRNETIARLEESVASLADALALQSTRAEDAESRIAELLQTLTDVERTLTDSEQLAADRQARTAELDAELSNLRAESETALQALRLDIDAARLRAEEAASLLAAADAARGRQTEELSQEREVRAAAEAELRRTSTLVDRERQRIALLNRQLASLQRQLASLQALLDAAERRDAENQVRIENLGQRLNAALAQKVSELARYRSEFFGRMQEALGSRSDIRIIGDRFVLESGVLFESASAALGPEGREDLRQVAAALRDISTRIPADLPWRLRVDGHTDRLPLRASSVYADNWELSLARAMAVVRLFVEEEGLPPERFAVTGFGEHAPLDLGDSNAAHARNRRIELTLTSR